MRKILTVVICLFTFCGCADFRQYDTSEIIKSQNDQREYRYVQLENGLKVMLISDPKTDFSAASLDVYTGSGSDPVNRQGLAHFLEHMLFLGTEKFPDSDDYMRFLKDNGGHHNAYTSFEHTNYFFDVKPESLDLTLDRFAQFFISPLLDEKYIEQEKHAVDSEYKSGIKNESRRNLDAMHVVFNEKHPFRKFSVGSLETLSNDKTSIKKDLVDFYQQYYVANNMAMAVLGRESLDELQRMIESKFIAIKSREIKSKVITEPLFREDLKTGILYVKPEKKLRELTLLFPLPDQVRNYQSRPLDIIAHVLGHEGKGSLLSYLKSKNWVEALSASQGFAYNGGTVFSIDISLTEEGQKQQDAIIISIFQAIKRLQEEGVPRWMFDEIAKVTQLEFDYKEKDSAQSYVLGISNNLHYYPARDVLSADSLLTKYNPQQVMSMLDQLTYSNSIIVVVNDQFKPEGLTEYYHVPYALSAMNNDLKMQLQNVSLNPEIRIPEKNTLLPDDLHIESISSKQDYPELLVDKPGLQLWHKPVRDFVIPKATSYFSFRKENIRSTAVASVLLDLYVMLLNDSFNEWVYPAHMAGLSFQLYGQMRGATLKIDGFNDKQDELLGETLMHIKNAQFSEQEFSRIKSALLKDWENAEKQPPYQKLMAVWTETLQKPSWSNQQKINALQQLELADVRSYASSFWSDVEVTALTNGNITSEQSREMLDVVDDFVGNTKKLSANISVLKLPAENQQRKIATDHPDTGYVLYWQSPGIDVKSQAEYMLLAKILESGFFNDLRTEQQLGYVVYSTYAPLISVPGLMFVVQSPTASVDKIHQAVLGFLDKSKKDIMNISPEYLLQMQDALRQKLLEQPLSLVEESEGYWYDLSLGYNNFDRKKQLAEAIRGINVEQWQAFIKEFLVQPKSRMYLFSTSGELVKGFIEPEKVKNQVKEEFYQY